MNTEVSRPHVEVPAPRHGRLWALLGLMVVAVGLSLGLLLTRGGAPPISPPASVAPTHGLDQGRVGSPTYPAEAPNPFRMDDRRFGEDIGTVSNPSAGPKAGPPKVTDQPKPGADDAIYDCRRVGPC